MYVMVVTVAIALRASCFVSSKQTILAKQSNWLKHFFSYLQNLYLLFHERTFTQFHARGRKFGETICVISHIFDIEFGWHFIRNCINFEAQKATGLGVNVLRNSLNVQTIVK